MPLRQNTKIVDQWQSSGDFVGVEVRRIGNAVVQRVHTREGTEADSIAGAQEISYKEQKKQVEDVKR